VRRDIEALLQKNATAPLGGAVGVKMINVLEMNLALRQRYGAPA
jgi:potassium-transporting ATPase KdpC subunit